MTSLTRKMLAPALGAMMIWAGCGEVLVDTDGGVDGDGGAETDALPPGPCEGDSIEFDDLFDCVRSMACDFFGSCFFAAPIKYCEYLDVEIFEDLPAVFAREVLADAVAAGRVTYDGAAAASCLADLRDMSCTDFMLLMLEDADPFVACGIVTGTIADGNDCNLNSECVTEYARCEREARDAPVCEAGICEAPLPVGGNCSEGGRCVPGAICYEGACRSGLAGSPCSRPEHCRHDYFCNNGTCAADFSTNASCTDDSQCTYPDSCIGLELPESTSGNCGRSDRENDPCDGRYRCGPGLWCDQGTDTASLGTCKPLPVAGEGCTPTEKCRADARCDANGQCVEKGDPNATCRDSSEGCHFGLYCSNELNQDASGICLAPAPTNNACSYGGHCQSGFCEELVCVEHSCNW
jgi:hypothetical protein